MDGPTIRFGPVITTLYKIARGENEDYKGYLSFIMAMTTIKYFIATWCSDLAPSSVMLAANKDKTNEENETGREIIKQGKKKEEKDRSKPEMVKFHDDDDDG